MKTEVIKLQEALADLKRDADHQKQVSKTVKEDFIAWLSQTQTHLDKVTIEF